MKALKCLSDMFSWEVFFINGVQSENMNTFKTLDTNGQTSLLRHFLSFHLLWQHTRVLLQCTLAELMS